MHVATPRRRRGPASVLIAAVALLSALALSQCRMVADNVVGVEVLHRNERNRCFIRCIRANQEALRIEYRRHQAAVEACDYDPVCLAEEEALHIQNKDAITERFEACNDDCHHQGGGDGQ
jgi:hypothetical protein